ncbi:MAG TPA: hypothetical protein PLB14_03375 [Smithellaceae bacterium]|jgi:hypothetical protein|nr:hypothetical protein [Syntrophaceae bacterium]HPV48722.1 hypothetical protein [Smithellaceae bacterium]
MSLQAISDGSRSSRLHTTPHYSSPWLFQNHKILTGNDPSELIPADELVKKINQAILKKEFVFLHLGQRTTSTQFLIKAYPQICSQAELLCRLEPADAAIDLKNYELRHLMIDDGLSVIISNVSPVSLDGFFLRLTLPADSKVQTRRKAKRHLCKSTHCKIIQGDFVLSGTIIDFTTQALGINITPNTDTADFNNDKPAFLILEREGMELYSGMGRCLRNRLNNFDRRLVFTPLIQQGALYPSKELPHARQQAGNAFCACFHHPFSNTYVERDICDISLTGFSICNEPEEDLLLPGMWIPELAIVYAGYVKMKCKAKVIYRLADEETGKVKYGLAMSGMDLETYTLLSRIIWASSGARIGIASEAEMDTLWEFMIEAGYFDQEQYGNNGVKPDFFKESYLRLYGSHQNIARQIIYKTNGKINGHIAMLRAYEPAWLIHHYAADRRNEGSPFLSFLKDVINYLAPFHRQQTAVADYFMAYYTPERDGAAKFFNYFARHANNGKMCSVDSFAAMHFRKKIAQKLPEGWVLRECTLDDLFKLKEFYEATAGGLLIEAMGVNAPAEALKKSFAAAGFRREYRTYCLCCQNKQLAFFIVNRSDISTKLDELLNGITAIIIEPDILSWAMFAAAVNNLAVLYDQGTIPLMIYPFYFLPVQNIKVEQERAIWILHTKAADECLSYINKLTSIRHTGP